MATTTRRRTKTATPEEAAAKLDALRETQRQALMTLTTEDGWTRWLTAQRLFRDYSFLNTMLILIQKPDATRVAGFKTWAALGRRITSGKGSGIQIWGKPYHPHIWVNKADLPPNSQILATDGDKAKIIAPFSRCPRLHVWDVSQTDGDPLPEIETAMLGDGDQDQTELAQHIIDRLTAWVTGQGWTIIIESRPGTARGSVKFSTRQMWVRDGLSVLDRARVMIHECSHMVLHNDETWAAKGDRAVREIQAESATYAVAGMLDLDTSCMSTGYVAGWAGSLASEPDAVLALVEKTGKAVHYVVRTLLPLIEDEAADGAADVAAAA